MAKKQKLTDQQKKFCMEYLTDMNAFAAAIRAGYAEGGQGNKLTRKKHIREYIAELAESLQKPLELSAEKTLNEIAILAFSDISEIAEWTTPQEQLTDEHGNSTFPSDITKDEEPDNKMRIGGVKLRPIKDLSRDQTACIQEITDTRYGVKIRMHSKPDALKLLAQIQALTGPKGTEEDPIHSRVTTIDLTNEEHRKKILDEYSRRSKKTE